MLRRTASVLALWLLCSAGCAHRATLDRSGWTAEFQGVRLNGEPVVTRTLEEEGVRYLLESSVFAYEVTPPFQSLQGVSSVSFADERDTWTPGPEQRADVLRAILRALPLALPEGHCEEPSADATLGRDALETRCTARTDGVTYWMRLRVVTSPRGYALQFASWTSDKGREWSDRFWSSFEATKELSPASPGGTAAPPVAPVTSQLSALVRG